jgi:F420-dependent methylenetetrahydromethanopterin dehydrogenase
MEFGEDKEKEPEKISFDDELRRVARAVPFVPFEITTTSGQKYEITDSVEMAIGTSTVIVVLPKTGVQMIRKDQIVAVHTTEPVE